MIIIKQLAMIFVLWIVFLAYLKYMEYLTYTETPYFYKRVTENVTFTPGDILSPSTMHAIRSS